MNSLNILLGFIKSERSSIAPSVSLFLDIPFAWQQYYLRDPSFSRPTITIAIPLHPYRNIKKLDREARNCWPGEMY